MNQANRPANSTAKIPSLRNFSRGGRRLFPKSSLRERLPSVAEKFAGGSLFMNQANRPAKSDALRLYFADFHS
ncbi:hypothetical protein [Methanolapillus millepedarum]|uniref:hypothetical protein n=1 Tax=Methanolapillus millepedarum TaxID=3028296 RepID=UPI0030B870D2